MNKVFRGFSTFLVVGLLLAISIPLSLAALMLSVEGGRTDLALEKGYSSLLLSESCTEDVILRLRNDSGYSASIVNLPEGDCDVSIASNGDERTVLVTANRDGYERTIRVVLTITPTGLVLGSWIEQSS